MRGCVSVLVLAAVFAVAVAWFGAPPLAGAAIQLGLDAAGLEARQTSVRVESDPPIEILGGHADRVIIGADDAVLQGLDIGRLDLVLGDVDLVARSFGTLDGTLTDVRVHGPSGTAPLTKIDVGGPADAADLVATMAGRDVERLATAAINDALGLPVGGATLSEPDVLRLTIAGQGIDGRLVVEPTGGIALALPLAGTPRVPLFDSAVIEVASVTVLGIELILTGTLDAREALAR